MKNKKTKITIGIVLSVCLAIGISGYITSVHLLRERATIDGYKWQINLTDKYKIIGFTNTTEKLILIKSLDNVYSLMDYNGNKVQTLWGEYGGIGSDMICNISTDGKKSGYIGVNSSQVIPPKYDYVNTFIGKYAVVENLGVCTVIDKQQNTIYQGTEGNEIVQIDENKILVKEKSNNKIISIPSKEVLLESTEYTDIRPDGIGGYIAGLGESQNSLSPNLSVYLDKNFQPKFGGQLYSNSNSFNEGVASVTTIEGMTIGDKIGTNYKEKHGVIDKKGKMILSGEYFRYGYESFSQGLCIVRMNKGFIGLNKVGETVFEIPASKKTDGISTYNEYFVDGFAPLNLEKYKYGYIDMTGKIVIEPLFDSASIVKDGMAVVSYRGQDGVIKLK